MSYPDPHICLCGKLAVHNGSCLGPCKPVSAREIRFKASITFVIQNGEYPSGKAILATYGSFRHSSTLNTDEATWRRDILTALGWTQQVRSDNTLGRFIPPRP